MTFANSSPQEGPEAAPFRQAPVVGCRRVSAAQAGADTAKVYFSRKIDAETLIRLYRLVNAGITGKVGIKLHTGEKHGPNILPRDMVRAFQAQIPGSAIVECNTLYHGDRFTTEDHRETLRVNGWTFCPVDIMDEDDRYVNFPVKDGLRLKEVAMGAHLADYDSLVVLTHFKGHAMGGFGGSLKNIAIGYASGHLGKAQVHGVGIDNQPEDWNAWPAKEPLMETMADSGKAVCDHFGRHITFLNVLRRMSVDCDCAGTSAAEPTIPDIGILASTDILAIDQASCDLVYGSGHNHDLVERMESRHGLAQLTAMRRNRMGAGTYQLIEI
ncbi:DUF362 domain-containing protein [Mesosutterella sp. AGMB02718]|uniref:DUF362 domain-containing protein n=1 Tax=Mesosutterella faecium TaxID=2925194 RepID=A0ABT7IPA3_9BURK|nr:DUF362 domain-containing protein [Mesosutterella sp. AGMB02718]MDL2060204.1 DUF362 domain-containing protein [Mesosutterella sp. AGMB02718]